MSSRIRLLTAAGIFFLAVGVVRPVLAQAHFGPELSWGSNSIGIGIGARVEVGLVKMIPGAKNFSAVGTFDYFFPSSGFGVSPSYWELGLGGQYHFDIAGAAVMPYAGAGLAIAHTSVSVGGFSGSATNVGLNLFGGTAFKPLGKVTPFAQLRLELQSSSAFFITGGVLF
ncbi:MAG TPA: hypothetical protein VEH62_14310 [Gemmatimonadales bacterium]|nr:hypothetical protein [Gemmatimonadales bacterium]